MENALVAGHAVLVPAWDANSPISGKRNDFKPTTKLGCGNCGKGLPYGAVPLSAVLPRVV